MTRGKSGAPSLPGGAGSDDLTQCILENIGVAAIVADEQGRIVLRNSAAEKIFGEAPIASLSERWSQAYGIYHSDGVTPIPLSELSLYRALQGDTCPVVEIFIQNERVPLGEWVECSARPFRDRGGAVRGAVATFRAVTETKQLLESITANEEKARLLLSSTAEGIYGLDLEGRCTFCNPSTLRLLGYPDESSLLGKNMHLLIHHSYGDHRPRPESECCIYEAFKRAEGVHREDEVYWKADGTSIAVEYSSFPVFRNGQTAGAVVVFRDISERKRAEDALRVSEERFRAAFERAAIGMAIVDGYGVFVEANQAFCGSLGTAKQNSGISQCP